MCNILLSIALYLIIGFVVDLILINHNPSNKDRSGYLLYAMFFWPVFVYGFIYGYWKAHKDHKNDIRKGGRDCE